MLKRLTLITVLALIGCRPPLPEPETGEAFLRGRFHNILGAGTEDVQICLFEEPELCTQTDASGQFILEQLPDKSDVTVILDREGIFPSALPHFTDDMDPPWDKVLLTEGNMNQVANRVGVELDTELGHVSFMAHQQHFREGNVDQTSGISFHIEPDVDASLYYLNSLQLPNPDLEATSNAGGGGALNLPPGDYELVLTNTGGPCEPIIHWNFTPGTRIPFTIHAGRGTYFDILCPQAE